MSSIVRNKMRDLENVFNTPILQYLSLKKTFLGEFLDPKAWGEHASRERVLAITKFLHYLKETSDLAVLHPSIQSQIFLDNRQLALGRILPLPEHWYEELMWNIVKDEEPGKALQESTEETLDKIKTFLITKQRSCLMFLESKVWEEVHDYENYITPLDIPPTSSDEIATEKPKQPDLKKIVMFKLKRFRKRLYSKARDGEDVSRDILDYQSEVDHYIRRFGKAMSFKELNTWKNKVSATVHDVENLLIELKAPDNEETLIEPEPSVDLEAVQASEDILDHLPDVPNELDAELEDKLLKLKFFNQVW